MVLGAPCLGRHHSHGDTGDTSVPGCVPEALRVYPMSLLPRDRLIEQLYGEITALKEELENFKAEVGGQDSDQISVLPSSQWLPLYRGSPGVPGGCIPVGGGGLRPTA